MLRTFRAGEFDPARLVSDKAGRLISVCLPARDEQDTVGPYRGRHPPLTLMAERWPLVDELLVVDDHSSDRTAQVAADAGATVLRADEILTAYVDAGYGQGRGPVEVPLRLRPATLDRLVRSRTCASSTPLVRRRPGGAAADPDRRRVREGLLRTSGSEGSDEAAGAGRTGDRAGGPSRHQPACAPAGAVRAAAGRRVRRAPRGARAAALRPGLRRRPRAPARHRAAVRALRHGPGRPGRASPPQPSARRAVAPGDGGDPGCPAPRRPRPGCRAPPRPWFVRAGSARRWT